MLKHGVLEAIACPGDEIFLLARVRGAGICGVFDDLRSAEAYIAKHRLPGSTDPEGGPSSPQVSE